MAERVECLVADARSRGDKMIMCRRGQPFDRGQQVFEVSSLAGIRIFAVGFC